MTIPSTEQQRGSTITRSRRRRRRSSVSSSSFSSLSSSASSSSSTDNGRNVVSFSLLDEVQLVETVQELPAQDLWFSRDDFAFIRQSAKVVAMESARYGHARKLNDTFSSNHNPDHKDRIQDQLNHWCLHGDHRRGLERWANGQHGTQRKDDQSRYISTILELQHKPNTCDMRMREVGHLLSRRSRTLAEQFGAADAHAAYVERTAKTVSSMATHTPRTFSVSRRRNLGLQRPSSPITSTSSSSRQPSTSSSLTGDDTRSSLEMLKIAATAATAAAGPNNRMPFQPRRPGERVSRMA